MCPQTLYKALFAVAATPQKRSPMCGKFLPFEVSTGMKLAPIFPSPRCDPDVIDSMLFSGMGVEVDILIRSCLLFLLTIS